MSRQQNEELLKIGGSVLKSLKLADYEATGRATGMDLEKVLKQVREPPSTAMLPCVTPPGPLTWPHGPQELWAAGMQKPDDELSELKFQALKRTLTIDECADATDDEEARTFDEAVFEERDDGNELELDERQHVRLLNAAEALVRTRLELEVRRKVVM